MRSIQTTSRRKGFRAPSRLVKKLFSLLDKFERWKIPAGELSIVFLDDAEMIQLHADFLNDPTPTDVITFPSDGESDGDGEAFAGEICVCIDQACREAPKHATTVADEILLYLVHGWLHLAGHDDLRDAPRALMRDAEKVTLAYLEDVGFSHEWRAGVTVGKRNSQSSSRKFSPNAITFDPERVDFLNNISQEDFSPNE